MYEVRRGYLRDVVKALPEGAEIVAVVPLLTRKPGTMEMECDVLVRQVSPVRSPKPAPSSPAASTPARTRATTTRAKKSPA